MHLSPRNSNVWVPTRQAPLEPSQKQDLDKQTLFTVVCAYCTAPSVVIVMNMAGFPLYFRCCLSFEAQCQMWEVMLEVKTDIEYVLCPCGPHDCFTVWRIKRPLVIHSKLDKKFYFPGITKLCSLTSNFDLALYK